MIKSGIKRTHNRIYSILRFSLLSIVGFSTVLGSYTSATEVYPTQILNQINTIQDDNKLSEIFQNLISFIKSGIQENNKNINKYSFDIQNDTDNILYQNIDSFDDIWNIEDKKYVNYLAQNNIISQNKKFYPNNFIRLHEVNKILVNLHLLNLWYDIKNKEWYSNNIYFNSKVPKHYNTAYELWLLKSIDNVEYYEQLINHQTLVQVLNNFQGIYNKNLKEWYIENNITQKENYSRIEFVKYIIELIWIFEQNPQIIDTTSTQWNKDIKSLFKNNEVPTYIINSLDQEITRLQFIELLSDIYSNLQDQSISIQDPDFNIKDIDYNQENILKILYAKQEWLINYLLETKRWNIYLKPNQKITKHEVYYIFWEVFWLKTDYNIIQADEEYIKMHEILYILYNNINNGNTQEYNSQLEYFIKNIKDFSKSKQLTFLLDII